MVTPKFILLALILAGSAVVFSMHGQGGGILYAPIQVLFGVEFHTAAANSQLFIIVTSLSSILVYHRASRVDWRLGWALESTAVVGGFLGGSFAYRFPPQTMLAFLGAVVAAAGVSMLTGYRPPPTSASSGAGGWAWRRQTCGQAYTVRLSLGLPLWFLVGLVSGMTGVAGGFLKIPMMVLLFGMPIDVAFGTSAFMISLTAAGGFLGHLTTGEWDWKPALVLSAFIAVGAQIGPRLTLAASRQTMRRRFGLVLLGVSMAILYLAWST